MKNIYKPENGIYGYAPPAPEGTRGRNGNNMYYSGTNIDTPEASSQTISLIATHRTFSPLQEDQDNYINYADGDLILTKDGSVYMMDNIDDTPIINRIGSIKIPLLSAQEGNSPLGTINVTFNILQGSYDAPNKYNYVPNCRSPLYHHRDSIDASVYGNYIQCATNLDNVIPLLDGQFMKLVLNFSTGLRFEKILDINNYNERIFIDNRYMLPYAKETVSPQNTYYLNYDEEKNASIDLQTNLRTGKSTMVIGYLEHSFQQRNYRKKITINIAQ